MLAPSEFVSLNGRAISKVRFPNDVDAWLVTRFEDFRAVMADSRFSARKAGNQPALCKFERSPLDQPAQFAFMDGAEHLHYRRLLTGEFTLRRVATLAPRIQQVVDESLDAMHRAGPPVDLVEMLSLPVPSMVIGDVLGVPYTHRRTFQHASNVLLGWTTTEEETAAAFRAVGGIVAELIELRREEPADDLISRLVHSDAELSVAEMTTMVVALLIAGHDTTANFTSLSVIALLEHPEQIPAVVDEQRSKGAVDELLRYLISISLSAVLTRQATEDVVVGDQLIKAGEWVACSVINANRDASVCPMPHQLDVDRDPPPNVTFGFGPHQCIGQNLARAEMRIILSSLFRRFPTLRLAADVRDMSFSDDRMVYGPRTLPVAW